MPPPFLTIDLRTSPITLSPFPSPKISPRSDTDDSGSRQNEDDLVSPVTPNDYSRLSGFPQLSGFDFAFDDRGSLNNPPSPSGPRRLSETTLVEQLVRPASPSPLSVVAPSNAVAGGVHRPAVATAEDAEAPPPYSRYAGASQPPAVPGSTWGGAAARVAGVQNAPPMAPVAVYTRGHQGFASVAGVPVNGNPRRQSGQRGLHALALADQSQQQQGGQFSRQDSWREKITAGYWETEVEVETGSENKRLTRKGRRCVFAVMGLVLLAIIIAVVVGVVTTRKNKYGSDDDDTSKESANIESLLPEPREGMHVVKSRGKPEVVSSCVSESSLWSCDLPSDSPFPKIALPDGSVLPEFRFIIRKETGSGPDTRTNSTPAPEDAADYASVAEVDDVRGDSKSGDMTEYYISLVTQDPSSMDQGPNRTTDSMPSPPSTSEANGSSKSPRKRGLRFKRQDLSAPVKNMFPETAESQPLRSFDSGLDTEHYGFHMYYTKTIHVTSLSESSTLDLAGGPPPNRGADTDVRWERTRFKVVIWTKKLSDGRAVLTDTEGRRVQPEANGLPYAVSIVQDRHGNTGPVTQGPGLSEAVQENLGEDDRCSCEWRNWRPRG
ncbi:hypothetical protein C7212DRAFT_348332 [Tuber magnatum]|uniref:Glycoprotease family protein n=1 Tax=Tuber magnatum TaxID=42249 RepID=A0A317SEX1_9PEZI|nr:hypothetical protein C7212DRAFT_348332 [Tuber magnatum]